MAIGIKTQKMLWGRAAGRCSYPGCKLELVEDETLTDDPTLVGENCHIVAEKDDGPRGDPAVPVERRNAYGNLVLLCCNHHKIIDSQVNEYTVEKLKGIKTEHERWVKEQLGLDDAKQRDDEFYAGIIEKWAQLADLDKWQAWTSWLLGGGQPELDIEHDEALSELRKWLLNRLWPGRYPALETALHNFRRVAGDLQNTFHEYSDKHSTFYRTRKFYKDVEYEAERHKLLTKRFDDHVDMVMDLTLELTRAANLVCDQVRLHLMPAFRQEEGHLVVEVGPSMEYQVKYYVLHYSPDERALAQPYPGLEQFDTARSTRAVRFGGPDRD